MYFQMNVVLVAVVVVVVVGGGGGGGMAAATVSDDFCYPLMSTVGKHGATRPTCAGDPERLKAATKRHVPELEEYLGCGAEARTSLEELAAAAAGEPESAKCRICLKGIELMRKLTNLNVTTDKVKNFARQLCVDLNIMHPRICEGMVDVYGDATCQILKESPLDDRTFCSVVFNGDCFLDASDGVKWSVELPSRPKPPPSRPDVKPGMPTLKVLHVADTHWDTLYREGAPSVCRAPLCCRADSEPRPDGNDTGGRYGGWDCDIPETTFDSFLEHAKSHHGDVDYILWTGDIPAHDLWDQCEEYNGRVLERTADKLRKAFPKVPIYPALGNHESVPPNLFPRSGRADSLRWLYDKLDREWHSWLATNSSETIRRGGFYTALARPGLRIVSLNTNYCYSMNWWLTVESFDPEGQLRWLVDVLARSEENGEKVHVIAHVPTGSNECVRSWQTNFYKIMNRFESTVAAQFYGHTHADEFEVFYDVDNVERAFGVAYVAPSLTTYISLNPGYRVYRVDGDHDATTRFVVDHETWVMDLEASNAAGRGVWYELYSARKAFNMSSLSPREWDDVYKRLKTDDDAFDAYHRYYWKDSPRRPPWDDDYRRARLCEIRSCVQYGR